MYKLSDDILFSFQTITFMSIVLLSFQFIAVSQFLLCITYVSTSHLCEFYLCMICFFVHIFNLFGIHHSILYQTVCCSLVQLYAYVTVLTMGNVYVHESYQQIVVTRFSLIISCFKTLGINCTTLVAVYNCTQQFLVDVCVAILTMCVLCFIYHLNIVLTCISFLLPYNNINVYLLTSLSTHIVLIFSTFHYHMFGSLLNNWESHGPKHCYYMGM